MKLSKLQCGDFKVCTTDTTKDKLSINPIASFQSWKLYNTNFSLVIQQEVAYIFIHIIKIFSIRSTCFKVRQNMKKIISAINIAMLTTKPPINLQTRP